MYTFGSKFKRMNIKKFVKLNKVNIKLKLFVSVTILLLLVFYVLH